MLRRAVVSKVKEYMAAGILGKQQSIVVDLGAGDAPYKPLFIDACRKYIACDLEAGPGIDEIFDGTGSISIADQSADCVVSFQVLEHVWDVRSYLSECRRLLSSKGRLLLSTHGTWLYHPHPNDYRRWTREGLIRELEENGFIVRSIETAVGPLAWTTQFRAFGYSHVLGKAGLPGRFIASLICLFMNIRMALEDIITPKYLRDTNAAIYIMDLSLAEQAHDHPPG